MMPLHVLSRFRSIIALSALLAALGAAPARAASTLVYWDRADDLGLGAGFGLSQTMAASAATAGIPIVPLAFVSPWNPSTLVVSHTINQSTLNPAYPTPNDTATIKSDWSATNNIPNLNDGQHPPLQNLYLVYEQPITNDQFTINGQLHPITYAAPDVGLTLSNDGSGPGVDWVIFQVPVDSQVNPLYFPAVSLGTLANGSTTPDYPLFYSLKHPQVFTENSNYKLGTPEWGLAFVSIPVPEPGSGLLLLVGLLVVGHRKRS